MSDIYNDAGAYLGMLDGLIAGKYKGLMDAVIKAAQQNLIAHSDEFIIPRLTLHIVEQAIIQTGCREPIEQYLNFCAQMQCAEADKPFKRKMSGMEHPDFLDGYNNMMRITIEAIYQEWYNVGLSIVPDACEYIRHQLQLDV